MDANCTHTNTGFDSVKGVVYCKDCGATVATVKAKPGKKLMIPGRRAKKGK